MPDQTINPNIFKTYDIRGKVGDDLTPEVASTVGRALGTYFRHICWQHQVVIGYDMRASSPALREGLVYGLNAAGCDVFDIGMVATPVLYHQAYLLGMAGVMITGSHLAKEYNGFKMVVGLRPLFGENIQALRELIEAEVYESGAGSLHNLDGINTAYRAGLGAAFRRGQPLHVVVDAGNGMGGLYAGAILHQLGHRVTELYCVPDGSFPNHHPNPERSENMQDLIAKVQEVGADVGLAFDGDADRVGVVDDQGRHLSADKVMAWLAQDILPRHPVGEVFVGDVLSSQVVFDVVRQYGGRPVLWASGHARIKAKMQAERALFGGESSGHMFFADRYPGFDDGIYAACRVVELLADSDQLLSAQIDALPQMYTTPEYRPTCPDEKKAEVIAGVKTRLGEDYEYVDVDGLRVQYLNGWGLLRPSGTEPVLSLRFEGQSEDEALQYKAHLVGLLREVYPDLEEF